MGKLNYQRPNIELVLIETEHGIAAGSNVYLEISPNANSIDIEDWQSSDGFIDENVNIFD